jgi:hypothetical protein
MGETDRLHRSPRSGPLRNQTPSATGSCTSPPASPAAPDEPDSPSTPPGGGPKQSPPPGPASAPHSPEPDTPCPNETKDPPALESPHTRRDTGRPVIPAYNNQPHKPAGTGESLLDVAACKIEASGAAIQRAPTKPGRRVYGKVPACGRVWSPEAPSRRRSEGLPQRAHRVRNSFPS